MQSTATIIDHRRRIRTVVLHINRNLDTRFSLAHLSGIACTSAYHFIRVFEGFMGETPVQYIIRKRMECAGFRLLETKTSITDLALNLAYATPSSFSKAFKSHFGISPRQFRDTISIEAYSKSHHPFRSRIGNRNRSSSVPLPMIINLPAIKMICMENRGVTQGNFLSTNLASFARFRQLIATHGLTRRTYNSVSIYPGRARGIEDSRALDFVGAITDRECPLPDPLWFMAYPPGKYAVFRHYGSYDYIMQTWNQAYLNWFPKSGRSLRDIPPLEIHLDVPEGSNRLSLKAFLLVPVN